MFVHGVLVQVILMVSVVDHMQVVRVLESCVRLYIELR